MEQNGACVTADYKVEDDQQRIEALRLLLLEYQPDTSVVFCNTKKEVQEVTNILCNYGFSAVALHGDLEQRDRDQTLVRFANNSASVMVATDVAARGLDIDTLDAVFNYHIARDSEIHVHRIGRTGRAGSKGIACSLYSSKESYKVGLLEDYLDRSIEGEVLPDTSVLSRTPNAPLMTTLQLDAGKKQKIRPGDILGALTGENGIAGSEVGKIQLGATWAYVAIAKSAVNKALKKLEQDKLKGRNVRVRQIN